MKSWHEMKAEAVKHLTQISSPSRVDKILGELKEEFDSTSSCTRNDGGPCDTCRLRGMYAAETAVIIEEIRKMVPESCEPGVINLTYRKHLSSLGMIPVAAESMIHNAVVMDISKLKDVSESPHFLEVFDKIDARLRKELSKVLYRGCLRCGFRAEGADPDEPLGDCPDCGEKLNSAFSLDVLDGDGVLEQQKEWCAKHDIERDWNDPLHPRTSDHLSLAENRR